MLNGSWHGGRGPNGGCGSVVRVEGVGRWVDLGEVHSPTADVGGKREDRLERGGPGKCNDRVVKAFLRRELLY